MSSNFQVSLVYLLALCATIIPATQAISPWFTSTYEDLHSSVKRAAYCYPWLGPVQKNNDFSLDMEYLVHQTVRFFETAHYEKEQIVDLHKLLDTICQKNIYQYEISAYLNTTHYTNKEVRCEALDQIFKDMYYVFRRAALNHSEPLNLSNIIYYTNASAPHETFNITDLILTTWVQSGVANDQVCNMTNNIKTYIDTKVGKITFANSNSIERRDIQQQQTSVVPLWIQTLFENLFTYQNRAMRETSTRFEQLVALLGYGLNSTLGGLNQRYTGMKNNLYFFYNSSILSLHHQQPLKLQNATIRGVVSTTTLPPFINMLETTAPIFMENTKSHLDVEQSLGLHSNALDNKTLDVDTWQLQKQSANNKTILRT